MKRALSRFAATALAVIALTALTAVAPQAASAAYIPMYVKTAWNDTHCLKFDDDTDTPYIDLCSNNGWSRWLFVPNPDSIVNNYRLIPDVPVHNSCLEQPDKFSAHLVVSWCDGHQNQSWTISFNGPGNRITNDNSGKCLDASYDQWGGLTGTVTAWGCYNPLTLNQQWYNNG